MSFASSSVNHSSTNPSYHGLVDMSLALDVSRLPLYTDNESSKSNIMWHQVDDNHVVKYKELLDKGDVFACINVKCIDASHQHHISMCKLMLQCCLDAGENPFPISNRKLCAIPEWKTRIQPLKDDSLFWYWVWDQCGRPGVGDVAMIMLSTRANYHCEIRQLRKQEKLMRNKDLLESMSKQIIGMYD